MDVIPLYSHQELPFRKEMQSSETTYATSEILYMAYETNSSCVFGSNFYNYMSSLNKCAEISPIRLSVL